MLPSPPWSVQTSQSPGTNGGKVLQPAHGLCRRKNFGVVQKDVLGEKGTLKGILAIP